MKIREEQARIIPGVSEEEIKERHRKAKEIMKQERISVLIVAGSQVNCGSGSHHIRYLTNIGIFDSESYLVFPFEETPCYSVEVRTKRLFMPLKYRLLAPNLAVLRLLHVTWQLT